ncbi:MAG: tetratricopeptide repeat protein [Planctomycetota bacterium]
MADRPEGEQALSDPDDATDDPFADDPLAEVSALEPEAAPEVERDPFSDSALKRAKARSKAKAPRREPADPFADDPLAEVSALEPEAAPEVERDPFSDAALKRAKARSKARRPRSTAGKASGKDPFAEDPLAGVPALDAAPEVEGDPFSDSALKRAKAKERRPRAASTAKTPGQAQAETPGKAQAETPPKKAETPGKAQAETPPKKAQKKAETPGKAQANEAKAADPFAEDPLAEVPALDAAPEVEADPFSDSALKRATAKPARPRTRPPAAAWKGEDDALVGRATSEEGDPLPASAPTDAAPPPESGDEPRDEPASQEPSAEPAGEESPPAEAPAPRPKRSSRPRSTSRRPRSEVVQLPAPQTEPPPASDSRLEPPSPELLAPPPSSRGPWLLFVAVLAVVLVGAGYAVQAHLEGGRLDEALAGFLAKADSLAPAEVVARAEELPPELREDAQVQARVKAAQTALAQAGLRADAAALVDQAWAEPDLEAALKLCNRAIVTFDGCAEAHALRARLAYARSARSGEGEHARAEARALEDLQTALGADPECGLAYWERAHLRWARRHDPEVREAIVSDLGNAQRYAGQSVIGSLALGYSLLLEGHEQRALRQFDAALERDPRSAPAQVGRARALLALGEAVDADRAATEAIKLAPQDPEPLAVRGRVRWARTLESEAREDLRASLALDPWQAESWGVLSQLGVRRDRDGKLELGELDPRREAASKALDLAPHEGLAHLTLAQIDEAYGRSQDALEHYAQAIEAGVAEPGPRLGRGLLLVRQGEWEAGERELAEVLVQHPQDPLALAYAGAADVELERWRSAGKRLLQALELKDPPRVAWGAAGVLALRATPADPDQACARLTRALELDGDDPELRFYRAEALLALDRPAEARDELARLPAGQSVGRIPARERERLLGHALFALDDFPGAEAAYANYLRGATSEDPHRALVQRRLERCRARQRGDEGPQDF